MIEKVKRKVLCNELEDGGVKMINLNEFQNGFYLEWVENLLGPEEKEWKKIPRHNLKKYGGTSIFESKISAKSIKNLKSSVSPFWYKALEVWFNNNTCDSYSNNIDKINDNEVLFNNVVFTYKNQHIWIYECIKFGIIRLKDIMIDDRIMNLNEFREKYPNIKQVVFVHNIIYNACQKYEGKIEKSTSSNHEIYFRGKVVGEIGRKGFLQILKQKQESHIITFWKRKFNVDIGKEHWTAGIESTREVRLRELHWKILHNIYPTNILLHKMKIRETNKCDFCDCDDFNDHFFVHCRKVQSLWIEIEKLLMFILNKQIKLTVCDKLIGIKRSEKGFNVKEKNIINHAILIGKLTISKFRYGMRFNIIDMFHREATLRHLLK